MIGFTIILCIMLYSIIHYLIKFINWFTEPDDYRPPIEKVNNISIYNYYIGDAYILTDNSESSADSIKCTYLLTNDIKEGDIVQLRKKDGTYRMTWSGKRPQRVSIRNVRYGRLPCAYEDMCWAEKV